jgi:hypothetical protein
MAEEVITPEEGTAERTLSGAGAPFTSWSSLESDIVVEDHELAGQNYFLSAQSCCTVHGKRGCKVMLGINPIADPGIASRKSKHNGRARELTGSKQYNVHNEYVNLQQGNVQVSFLLNQQTSEGYL